MLWSPERRTALRSILPRRLGSQYFHFHWILRPMAVFAVPTPVALVLIVLGDEFALRMCRQPVGCLPYGARSKHSVAIRSVAGRKHLSAGLSLPSVSRTRNQRRDLSWCARRTSANLLELTTQSPD